MFKCFIGVVYWIRLNCYLIYGQSIAMSSDSIILYFDVYLAVCHDSLVMTIHGDGIMEDHSNFYKRKLITVSFVSF